MKNPRATFPRRLKGLATVLVLLALAGFVVAFMLYRSFGAASKRLDISTANGAIFDRIDQALGNFVMANSRLPCPASGTAHSGLEDPKTGAADPYKDCNSPSGVLPWITIGLRESDVLDAWGRYIGYRVFDGAYGFTQSTTPGLLLSDCLNEAVSSIYTLSGTSTTCNTATHENTYSDYFATYGITINDMGATKRAAYALISMGESGFGAYFPNGTAPLTSPSSSSKEYLNAGSAGTYWITPASDPTVAPDSGAHFDDVIRYVMGNDLVRNASYRPGKSWALYQAFTQSNVGLSGGNYNTQVSSIKVRPSSAGVNQGPIMVTAAPSRMVCATSTPVQGVAPCLSSVTNGNDLLDTTGGENLTFDFRVTRSALVIAITDFKSSGGGGTKEQAQVTFYNGSTQVDQKTVQSCQSGGHPVSQHTIVPAVAFTKVVVTALSESVGSTSSDFGVAAMMACKTSSECPNGVAASVSGWPSIDCFSAPL